MTGWLDDGTYTERTSSGLLLRVITVGETAQQICPVLFIPTSNARVST